MAPTQNLAGPSNVDTDCCASCTFHRDAIISACTHAKNRDELARLLPCICSTPKPWRMKDTSGKSMFHMAASMGREEIMTWYLKCRGESSLRTPQEKSALVDEVDAESGWTALHRALFQGEIAAASWLLRQGADISIKDHDDCSPVQLLIWDQQNLSEAIMITESSPKAKGACYPVAFHTWGNNANYTLGYGGATQDRVVPEKVRAAFYGQPNSECINCGHSDTVMGRSVARGEVHIHGAHLPPGALMSEHLLETYLPSVVDNYTNRQGLALDVVLRKFHTIFLSPDGVFVCGHGQGGRLGLGSEKTCLTPTRISFRSLAKAEPPQIVRIAAGVNHSVFLDADGIAYSCGLNEFFQLGMSPPPISLMVPTALPSFHSLTHRRSRSQAAVGVPVYHGIIGIAAERCHTLAWSSEAIYAIGFNGGQLGPRRDRSKGVSPGGSTSDASDLTNLLPREMTELKQYLPARFVRCSDAAFVIYRDPAYAGVPDMVLVHDYEIKRLPRLPRLSGVMWKEPPALSEICVFGGKLTLPGREMSLNRDLVIVALVSDIPLLYVDSGRSSYWSVINISGLPRNMSSIYHISLSSDQLLVSTEFGEVYTIPFSQSDRNKVTAHGPTPPRAAERVAKLWRALKVFSEPGSRSFAALQRSAPFRLWPMETHQSNGVSRTRHSPSTDTSVLIVADRGAINVHIEKLYLVAGSTYFRNLLPEFLDDSTFPAVLKIPGKIPSHVKFHRAVDDAKKLAQWQEIRRDFYPTARGLWDVEPDMEVVCDEDGATIGTHRFKLTSRTLYFELLLEGERWRNSRQTHTAVLPCDLPTGLRFMEFLYEKRISDRPATAEECLGLLRVADFIMDDELRAVAAEFFRPFLTADTVVNFLRIAEMYNAEGLRMSCVELMLCMLPGMSSLSKQDDIWSKIQATAYPLEALPQGDAGLFSRVRLLRPGFDRVSFEHTSDEMPDGRAKLIHAHGSVAKVELKIKENCYYSGIFASGGIGLARLSLALWNHEHYIPGMAVKIFVEGQPSQNMHVMNALDGQGKNRNFFEHKFSNVLEKPVERPGKLLAGPFRKAIKNMPGEEKDKPDSELILGLSEQAVVNCHGEAIVGDQISVPFQIIFTPNPANGWAADSREDLRIHLARIPQGSLLYNVYARRIPGGPTDHIGELVSRSAFVASQYGDEKLFFQHARKRWHV
ncbi:putative Inhibitor of Bruton tyrosine kinase [Hypsibius exemplaris]|uniref:Inhibitor of Bruton tyrosine kinase n=1 Tax=Hypsibius exemplaris TaxID=2072580 RepID=A0A1W0WRI7_HYPEX|nr:putative Inhibitor of Bruton tyrosine kinase [Hypsibius exemplaris]